MKKAILPAMIAALLATSAQAATVYDADGTTADVYGRMQFKISEDGSSAAKAETSTSDKVDANQSGLDGEGSARLGFKAASPINSHVNAIAKGEFQIASETSNNGKFDVRELYAGFDSAEMGSLVFGQTFTAFYQTTVVTDYFNTGGFKSMYNNIDPYRQEGHVVYSGEFSGVSVGASYQFQNDGFGNPLEDDDNTTLDATTVLDNSYALSLGYKIADVKVSGGYLVQQFATLEDKKNFALSATYAMNDLYLAAVYAESKQDNVADYQAYDLLASYALVNDVHLLAGYGFEEKTDNITGIKADSVDEATLSAQYSFNNQLKTWIEYKADMITGADDAVEIALQYNF
jgi:outer membrane protein N